MKKSVMNSMLAGRWHIVEMEVWDQEAVDLVAPGFIEFDEAGAGELGFIAVAGELAWRHIPSKGQPRVEFTWTGSDEGDLVEGRGWARLVNDGRLTGRIYISGGDDSAFTAERFEKTER